MRINAVDLLLIFYLLIKQGLLLGVILAMGKHSLFTSEVSKPAQTKQSRKKQAQLSNCLFRLHPFSPSTKIFALRSFFTLSALLFSRPLLFHSKSAFSIIDKSSEELLLHGRNVI